MIKRITIKNIRMTFTIAKVAKVIGVNSNLEDGRHILMWDFDDVSLNKVEDVLKEVQFHYQLSDIFVVETKSDTNFIAYCFTALDWRKSVEIIASTPRVDYQFLRFGVYRGHWTLRVTPKNGRKPKFVARLLGLMKPTCSPKDLKSWVKYETLSWR
jgi:hypothetical protein